LRRRYWRHRSGCGRCSSNWFCTGVLVFSPPEVTASNCRYRTHWAKANCCRWRLSQRQWCRLLLCFSYSRMWLPGVDCLFTICGQCGRRGRLGIPVCYGGPGIGECRQLRCRRNSRRGFGRDTCDGARCWSHDGSRTPRQFTITDNSEPRTVAYRERPIGSRRNFHRVLICTRGSRSCYGPLERSSICHTHRNNFNRLKIVRTSSA
jgi:hypothetical protein